LKRRGGKVMFDGAEKRGRPARLLRVVGCPGDEFRVGAEFDWENLSFMLQNAIVPEGMRLMDGYSRRVLRVVGREIPAERKDARGWGSQRLEEEEEESYSPKETYSPKKETYSPKKETYSPALSLKGEGERKGGREEGEREGGRKITKKGRKSGYKVLGLGGRNG
jgi:hypothetical protein